MPARVSTRFQNLRQAAKFYGVSYAQFVEAKKQGLDHGDPLPYEDPEQMASWYARMHDLGIRRWKCPDSVVSRSIEAKTGKKVIQMPRTPEPESEQEDAGDEGEGLEIGREITTEELVSSERQLYFAMSERLKKLVGAGDILKPEATALQNRLAKLGESIRNWAKSLEAIRASDNYIPVAEVSAGAGEFCSGLVALLRREIAMQFTAAEHERIEAALDRVAEKMPGLLPSAFAA